MSKSQIRFSEGDISLAEFAKAIALPVRIAILRRIIASGNELRRAGFDPIPYNPESVNKHLSELRALGIIKVSGGRGDLVFSVDDQLFNQMANSFIHLLKVSNDKPSNNYEP